MSKDLYVKCPNGHTTAYRDKPPETCSHPGCGASTLTKLLERRERH